MATSIGNVNKAFVSSMAFVDAREINHGVIDSANDTGFLDTLQLFNRTKKTDEWVYRQFVTNDMFVIAVANVVTTTGNPTLTVTLSAGNAFYRTHDILKLPNGKNAVITNVTTSTGIDTLSLQSVDGSNLTLATGNQMTYAGVVNGESSVAIKNRRYDVTPYFNLIQIMREIDIVSDVQKAAKVETEFEGKFYYTYSQLAMKAKAFKATISLNLLAGVQSVTQFSDSAPVLVDENGNPEQTTMGLDQYTTTYGTDLTIGAVGTIAIADLKNLAASQNAVKAPVGEYLCYTSDAAKITADIYFKNLNSSGVTPIKMEIDGKSVNMNVDQFSFGNRQYQMIPMSIADHPNLLTAKIKGSMYLLPKGKIHTSTGDQPRIQVRYIPNPKAAQGFGTEMILETQEGMLADSPTNGTANLTTHYYTAQGLECAGAKHFTRWGVNA